MRGEGVCDLSLSLSPPIILSVLLPQDKSYSCRPCEQLATLGEFVQHAKHAVWHQDSGRGCSIFLGVHFCFNEECLDGTWGVI